jgi:ABC-type oligopeptide transport system substrate-binding subunit
LFAIGFSYETGVVSNPLVRRALSLAIDRQRLAAQLSSMDSPKYLATSRFTPLTVIAAPAVPGAQFDETQASALMQEAGYGQCANLPTRFSMAVTDDPLTVTLGQALIEQWQQNLGCAEGTFELTIVSRQVLVDNAHATLDLEQFSRLPLWLVTWTADYPDANAWVADALHCQFGVLRTGRNCDNSDAVLDQAGLSNDLGDRIAGYSQVETAFFGITGSFPVIPLIIRSEQWVQQTWLSGVSTYGPFQFDQWTVSPHS